MSKIIDDDEVWFQEVAPHSYYDEEDLERAIIQNLHIIFPEFVAIPFKLLLLDPLRNQSNKADLAIIKRDYSEWYVIEVEMAGHSVTHVMDQVKTFYNCNYTDDHAIYIYQKCNKRLDLLSLKKMVANTRPQLMVIVNESVPDWTPHLKTIYCKSCIFQIYHNYHGNALYRIMGEHPFIKTEFCHCTYEKTVPYIIKVLDSDFLDSHGVKNGESINVEFKEKVYAWVREDSGSSVFLRCDSSGPPLDPLTSRYRLNAITQKTLRIRRKNGLIDFLKNIWPFKHRRPIAFATFSFTKD